MKTHLQPPVFANYKEYLDYQVKKCVTPIDHPYYKGVFDSHLRILGEYLGDLARDAYVLDCGCGYGFALRAFRQSGFSRVIGIDLSEDRLAASREVGYPIKQLDMHAMGVFGNETFDAVYSSHSLEHGLHPDRALAEIFRVLKPEGMFMLVLPYPVALDDDHVRKAHCGAEYLNLTTNDRGSNLVRVVERFGFSLIARGFGSYRDEAEIYLKFAKRPAEVMVKDYGPRRTCVNTRFNVQPSGLSAIWFIVDDPYESDLVIEFDGLPLKTERAGNTLSAVVPDVLLEFPGEVDIRVIDVERPQRAARLRFEVLGEVSGAVSRMVSRSKRDRIIPNFFIIGAPRSGTTSMYWHLASHPEIYMARIKEPFYFDERAHGVLSQAISKEDQYVDLFRYAPFDAKVIGEASTTYLSSRNALERIHDFNPEARILVMLRNPIAATVSMYLQMLQGGKYENAQSFEAAWRAGESEARPFVTRYSKLFSIGKQLLVAESIFGREGLKLVLYDDLTPDGNAVYRTVLDFLNLPFDAKGPFPRSNSANWENIHSVVSQPLLDEMIDRFAPQVHLVSEYTGRSLEHWLTV